MFGLLTGNPRVLSEMSRTVKKRKWERGANVCPRLPPVLCVRQKGTSSSRFLIPLHLVLIGQTMQLTHVAKNYSLGFLLWKPKLVTRRQPEVDIFWEVGRRCAGQVKHTLVRSVV